MRRSGKKVLVWLLGAVLALATVLAIGLSTLAGQRTLLGIAATIASTSDTRLRIGRLTGSLFSRGHLDRIAIEDAKGNWLELMDIQFDWTASALLFGRLDVAQITVGRLVVDRPPETATAPRRRASTSASLPIGIRIADARIAEIHLGEAIAGDHATLTARASLSIDDLRHDMSGKLYGRRTDGTEGEVQAEFSYAFDLRELALDLVASEPANGIVANVLNLSQRPPLRAILKGTGPLDDWSGTLTMDSAGTVFARLGAAIERGSVGHRLTVDLNGYFSELAPIEFRDLLAGKTVGQVRAALHDDGTVAVQSATLTTEAVALAAHGRANLATGPTEGRASLKLARADNAPIRLPFAGSVAPAVVSAIAAIEIAQENAGGNGERVFAVDLAIEGFTTPDRDIRNLVGSVPRFDARGRIGPTAVSIDTATVSTRALKAAGSGKVRGGTFRGSLNGSAHDLSAFSNIANQRLSGRGRVAFDGTAAIDGGTLNGVLTASLSDFGIGQRVADRLLAGTNDIKAKLMYARSSGIEITDAVWRGPAIAAEATGTITPSMQRGRLKARVSNLNAIAADLSGVVSLDADFANAADNVSAALMVTGHSLRWRGHPVDDPSLKLEVEGPSRSVNAKGQFSARYRDIPITGGATIRLAEAAGASIPELDLRFGRSRLKGWLDANTASQPKGEFALDVPDLGEFSEALGAATAGSLKAQVELAMHEAAPKLKVRISGSKLAYDTSSIGALKVQGDIAEYLAAPRGQIEATVTSANLAGRPIAEGQLRVQRHDGPAAFRLSARGDDETLNIAGTATIADRAADVTLNRVDIGVADVQATLAEPARLTVGPETVAFQRVVLRVGDGTIDVAGTAGPQLGLTARLNQVPASLADAFTKDLAPRGFLNGDIRARGPVRAPVIEYAITLRESSFAATRAANLPAVTIDVRGKMEASVVSVNGRLQGPDGIDVRLDGSLGTSSAARLDLRTRGQIPFSLLDTKLAGRGLRASGTVAANATIGGTIAAPKINGEITSSAGRVRDPETGLDLFDIRLSARFDERHLIIDRLDGRSKDGGTVQANGRIGLDADAGLPSRIDIAINGLDINDRRMIQGRLGGRIRLSGAVLEDLLVSGEVSLGRFDINIPDRLPKSISEINVEHVNPPPHLVEVGADTSSRDQKSGGRPIRLALEVVSDGQIFVRGRGLDAQLGGRLKISGTTADPVTEGAFQMQRGQIAIVGRRLVFNRGTISFVGNLDPVLDFQATVPTGSHIVTTTVSGRASNPSLRFSSAPELPQDEALARLLFNTSLSRLSPIQIAQLAAEIDRLGGLSGAPDVLSQLRRSVGIDVLDVTTDEAGKAQVSAGKNLNDRVYVGVKQSSGAASSSVVIDLGITDNIKARAQTDSGGRSKVGIGVEWNY
jgi:translocation and assembly module TamB